jgi:hypothetical protein
VIAGGSRGSGYHSDSFDIESGSVCLVDFALCGTFFFGPMGNIRRSRPGIPSWDGYLFSLCVVFFLLSFFRDMAAT